MSSVFLKFIDNNFCCFQSDFSGRVVNNDHFLYWGDVVKTNEEGVDFHIQVYNNNWIYYRYVSHTVGSPLYKNTRELVPVPSNLGGNNTRSQYCTGMYQMLLNHWAKVAPSV
jgi:hypothetical protein